MAEPLVMSKFTISEIYELLNIIERNISEFNSSCDRFVSALSDNATVQSMYTSGEFGESMQDNINNYKNAVSAYVESISGPGGLIPQTRKFLANQESLLSSRGVY